MVDLSSDPVVAERQMNALVFYLTAFGYIDGEFNDRERALVHGILHQLVHAQVEATMASASAADRAATTQTFAGHFYDLVSKVDLYIRGLYGEARAKDEDATEYVSSRLMLRCYETFLEFSPQNRTGLIAAVDAMMADDGKVHRDEVRFRLQLEKALAAEVPEAIEVEITEDMMSVIDAPQALPVAATDPAWLSRIEVHYAGNANVIAEQFAADVRLAARVTADLAARREAGRGKLTGVQTLAALAGQAPFLDGFVYAQPKRRGAAYDLTVVGDLHGCYSNLKAALAQSRFFEKLAAWRKQPQATPEPKLILLGDYIDRGIFSFDGVLRAAMELYLAEPDHVFLLRGNHEYFVEYNGRIYGGVKPSEGISSLLPYLSDREFSPFMAFFEALPSSIIFDHLFFVHAGIPRDSLMRERYQDLGSLNDADMRFQMMWSDPVSSDYVPEELQNETARFRFGQRQFAAFMARIGCSMMVRGHEKIDEGFCNVYPQCPITLLDVFSAGGSANNDVPEASSYRTVRPMAATIELRGDATRVIPWALDYRPFMHGARNGFYARPRDLAHIVT
ncbi:MAG: serine/threonine protein phosphatase [Myxococcales bacterium]|nr:serine/threonine protein phosphatase [Myxococcales bacterium]